MPWLPTPTFIGAGHSGGTAPDSHRVPPQPSPQIVSQLPRGAQWQADPVTATDALRHAGAIGPYFAVDLEPSDAEWLPLTALIEGGAAVAERVGFVRGALATRCGVPVDGIDARAAASIHFLGLASRLVAPALGAAAVDGIVPVFGADDVRWQRVAGGPVPIGLAPGTAGTHGTRAAGVGDAAVLLLDGIVSGVVAPVMDAFADAAHVSRIVLWGNVASGLAGAASMLARSGATLELDPAAIVEAMLALPGPLHSGGAFGIDGRFFVRASCCLFYRIPNGGKCGDCVLL
jgi:hypothetical protein